MPTLASVTIRLTRWASQKASFFLDEIGWLSGELILIEFNFYYLCDSVWKQGWQNTFFCFWDISVCTIKCFTILHVCIIVCLCQWLDSLLCVVVVSVCNVKILFWRKPRILKCNKVSSDACMQLVKWHKWSHIISPGVKLSSFAHINSIYLG